MKKEQKIKMQAAQSSIISLTDDKTNLNDEVSFSPIDELQLMVDHKNQEDKQELNMILFQLLGYPSQILADHHSQAMRLGMFDLESQTKTAHESTKLKSVSELSKRAKLCRCCGFKRQEENIKMCTSFDDISNMGASTYLYFVTFKNLSILLAVMTAVYSAFALATNVIASNKNQQGDQYTVDYLTISLASKQANQTDINKNYYYIQAWLGVVTVIIWIVLFVVNRYRETKDAQEYDEGNISVSDYSVALEGVPSDITLEQIQKDFNAYGQNLNRMANLPQRFKKKQLKIIKLSVGRPFYMAQDQLRDKQAEQIDKEIENTKQTIKQWIRERRDKAQFSNTKAQREEIYKKLGQLYKKKVDKMKQLEEKISIKLKQSNKDQRTTVFVTFQTNFARDIVLLYNQKTIFSKLRGLCGDQHLFSINKGGNVILPSIERAPQPEDIIWTNIGLSDCQIYGRKIFTYTVTIILLGICFMIVYFLSKAQQQSDDDRVLSIVISIVIAIVNVILGQVIRFLTLFEKDYTSTNRQASLAIKSILAQMINSILTPTITAYYIKTNTGVYMAGGLVDNIFMMAITNSLVPPILVLLDPFVLVTKLLKCLKSRKNSKLSVNQKELNVLFEGLQFQVGFQYIYIVNLTMFVCYFISLQPIVSVIGLLGFVMMYWVQKYCMFYRYKRPVPGTDFVNRAVYQIIFMGPLVYSLGSLTWSNFDPSGIPKEALLPNLIAVVFSAVLVLVPMNTIVAGCCFKDGSVSAKQTTYENDRMFFPTEYDRANPSTSKEGREDFEKYMKKKAEQISKKPKEEQEQLQNMLAMNMQRGVLNQNAAANTNPFGFAMGNQAYQSYNPVPIMQPVFSTFVQPQPAYGGGGMMPAYQNPGMQRGYAPNQMNMGPAPVPQAAFNPYGFGQMPQQAPFPGFGGGYGGQGGFGGFGGYGGGYGGGFGGFGGGYRAW